MSYYIIHVGAAELEKGKRINGISYMYHMNLASILERKTERTGRREGKESHKLGYRYL